MTMASSNMVNGGAHHLNFIIVLFMLFCFVTNVLGAEGSGNNRSVARETVNKITEKDDMHNIKQDKKYKTLWDQKKAGEINNSVPTFGVLVDDMLHTSQSSNQNSPSPVPAMNKAPIDAFPAQNSTPILANMTVKLHAKHIEVSTVSLFSTESATSDNSSLKTGHNNTSVKNVLDMLKQNKGMLSRALYVLTGTTAIIVIYFLCRYYCVRTGGKDSKYGVTRSSSNLQELKHLEESEDDEMTVFDSRFSQKH